MEGERVYGVKCVGVQVGDSATGEELKRFKVVVSQQRCWCCLSFWKLIRARSDQQVRLSMCQIG